MSSSSFGRRVVRKSRAVKSRWASRYSVSLGTADPDLIFIAGTGRSGTTWLAELLARNSRRRLVFEPFRNDRVPLWKDAASRQYIRPGDSNSRFLEPARQILAPGFRNDWADYYNERLITRGRIVKDIRANLILRWLYEQVGPFPIVLLIRNPGAVAASWLREDWSIEPSEVFLRQEELVVDYLATCAQGIGEASDSFEKIVYSWCIETMVPLAQFSQSELSVVVYEELIRDPERELTRLLVRFGESLKRETVHALRDPSATTTPGVVYASECERLFEWRDRITPAQLARLQEIVGYFGLDALYERTL